MEQYYEMHNITVYEYPVIFIGSDVLTGANSIESQLVPLLENGTGANCPFVNATSTTTNNAPNLAIIVGYAFADSLNPCAISVLLILIALAAATVGIWKTGIAYILGNFVAYLLIGFGLFTVLQQFNLPVYLSKVIGVATIILAVFTLYSRIPGASKPTIKKLLHAATSPIFAFIAGAAISAIELPCTVGPYFLALTLVTQYHVSRLALLGYLLLYNTIFVLPLVVVLLAYHFAGVTEVPKKYIRWTSAILLLVLGVVLLVF
jgi:cytochrome c biogenesis protein CcdA